MEKKDVTLYKAEVYKYAAENSKRFKAPNQKHIWEIIIDRNLFCLSEKRFEIVMAWHDEWTKIIDTFLVALRGLVNHFYLKTKSMNI